MDALMTRRRAMRKHTLIYVNAIKFDGLSYVDTGYILPDLASVCVHAGDDRYTDPAAQGIFFAQDSNGGTGVLIGGGSTSARRQMVPYYDSASYLQTDTLDRVWTSYSLFLTPKRMGWGNTTRAITKGNNKPSASLLIGKAFNYCYTGETGTLRIYSSEAQNSSSYAEITDNYAPVATFRPCIYDGVAGFWYVEGGRFCGNSNPEGTLTPIV